MKETDPYIQLVLRFPLRPLRSAKELDRAVGVIDALLDRDDLSPAEVDYLDVLGDLVHRYEQEHQPLGPVTDAEMLRFLMASRDVTQSVVAKDTGIARATLTAVLKGTLRLTREDIAAVASYFQVDPGVFAFDVEGPLTRSQQSGRAGLRKRPERGSRR